MTPNLPISLDSDDKMKSADQKFCFSCGAVLHHSANACPKCGASQPVHLDTPVTPWRPNLPTSGAQPTTGALPPNHVYCRGCGSAIHETASTCPKCGAQQRVSASTAVGRKDRVTASVLAILLGSFGAHRFYLGHIGLGFLYLIFFWTWIPGIVGLIEGIIYLTQSDEEFKTKYG
jgi:TM2 domain-containing membrane protein YozV/predicted RNA-binding Zn-ribbon protein involved in translation (DUF1610 family)